MIAITQLGGGGGDEPLASGSTSPTASTGPTAPTGPTGETAPAGGLPLLDTFDDPSTGWETAPQNGV